MIYIGADHAGFKLKEKIKKYLKGLSIDFFDVGAKKLNPKDDYPVFAKNVASNVIHGKNNRGIIVCGTGLGSCIFANKIKGIRATSAWNIETAKQSREHLDANVLCLGQKVQTASQAKKIIKIWLDTGFSKEERHLRRIKMI